MRRLHSSDVSVALGRSCIHTILEALGQVAILLDCMLGKAFATLGGISL